MNSLITELEKCKNNAEKSGRFLSGVTRPNHHQLLFKQPFAVRNMLKHLGSCLSPLPALICCSLSVSLGILAVLLTFDSPESTRKRLPVEVTLSLRGSKLVNYARATTCDFKFHCVRACCIAGFTKPVAGQLVFIANQKTMVP
jgi:hypothetical protein